MQLYEPTSQQVASGSTAQAHRTGPPSQLPYNPADPHTACPVPTVAQVVGNAHALAGGHLCGGGLAQLSHLRRSGGGVRERSAGCCAMRVGGVVRHGTKHEWHPPQLGQPPPPEPPTLSADRPMTETMPEGVASAAACMLSPRSFTSRTPSSNSMAPAGARREVQQEVVIELACPVQGGREPRWGRGSVHPSALQLPACCCNSLIGHDCLAAVHTHPHR